MFCLKPHAIDPIPVYEHTLVDICDILGAERFTLEDTRVTFFKRHPGGSCLTWSGELGDHLVAVGSRWRISSEFITAQTTVSKQTEVTTQTSRPFVA